MRQPVVVSSAERKRFFDLSQSVIDAAAALNHDEAMAAAPSAHCEDKAMAVARTKTRERAKA
ncbi:MAG: hypothetical protein F4051_05560 [Boseongicola sp. SB0670_bin_30]|nr:hypothetical protein [Boseongicola sp. SB0670_bin_30]